MTLLVMLLAAFGRGGGYLLFLLLSVAKILRRWLSLDAEEVWRTPPVSPVLCG